MDAIDTPAVVAFVSWLRRQTTAKGTRPSHGSIKKILAPLSGGFRQARLEGLVQSNPVVGVPIPSDPIKVIHEEDDLRVLSHLQLGAFLAKVPDEHRMLFDLLAATGLRVSELFGLDGRHLVLDDDRPAVKVRQAWRRTHMEPVKTRYGSRDVPIPGRLVEPLRALGRAPHAIVFPSDDGGRLSDDHMRRQVIKPTAKALGFGWAGFHTFRHTCASMLFASGYSVLQVQRWLGHHKASFTLDTYVHLLPDDLPAAFDPLAIGVRTEVQTGPAQSHPIGLHSRGT